MRPPTKPELVMEKILQAEAALQAYVQSGEKNPERQKQLTDAVEVAMDKFIEQF
jgi:hypothetical protein